MFTATIERSVARHHGHSTPNAFAAGNSARRAAWCQPPSIMLFLLLLCGVITARSEENLKVKVYSLFYLKRLPNNLIEALNAGFNASLASRQWTVAPNVTVEVVPPPSNDVPLTDVVQNIIDENKGKHAIIIGPIGDIETVRVLPLLHNENIVAFGPVTGSDTVRGWNPNVYFLRVSPIAELIALVRYAVSYLRLLRIGFMYLQDIAFGDKEYEHTVWLLHRMGRELCGVFTLKTSMDSAAEDEKFESAWERFAQTRPQGIIIFSPPSSKDTLRFITTMVADKRTRDAYLLAPSALEFVLQITWQRSLAAVHASLVSSQVVLTGTNPLAKNTQYQAIKRFQDHARSYLATNPGATVFSGTDNFDHHDVDGEVMVYGWIVGEVLSQALSSREWLTSREAFVKSLYNQRRYVIDDLVIGDFGGDCKGAAGDQGAACNCNQGGNVVYLKAFSEDYKLLPKAKVMKIIHHGKCDADDSILYAPFTGLFTITNEDHAIHTANKEIHDSASTLTLDADMTQFRRLFFHLMSSTSTDVVKSLNNELETRSVTAVFGVVDPAMLSIARVAFVDPMPLTPRLRHRGRNAIYLSPTLEQQLFVILGYLANASVSGPLHAIVRGGDGDAIESVLRKTAWSHGNVLQTVSVVDGNSSLDGHLSRRGKVLLVGLVPGDAALLAAHLGRNPNVHVFVPFFDVALMYDEVVAAFNGSSSGERVQFATSLPHWADTNTASETVRGFHAAVPDTSKWSPLSLLGYAAARFAQALLPRMDHVTPKTLLDTIYTQSVITADDMRYGPFEDEGCPADENATSKGTEECTSNYGAVHISVWSVARALNASVPPLSAPVTPSLQYTDPNAGGLSSAQLAGVIVGSLVVIGLLVAPLVMVLYMLRRGARDNDSAPKDPVEPVTLMFTDIESSTAQWASHPELMPDAVATHHRLVRSLIGRYGCYEVKTVGDSFMIACKSPFAATQLACELQRCFVRHEWGTAAFDETYREFERQRAEEDTEYTPPSAGLDPDVYHQLWNGLRVRVGIHTGLCDIRHDEVTKGYDYYGRTSNMAARTESVANGGQVLMTRAAYLSLSAAERGLLGATALGSMSLRGVPEPVEMYQVNAVPGRTFAALRLDHDPAAEDGELFSATFSDSSSSHGALSGTSLNFVKTLKALFGAFSDYDRQLMLLTLCERWQVAPPAASKGSWTEGHCEEVIRRISIKVGRVVDHCSNAGGDASVSTLRSASLIIISNRGLEREFNGAL